jgi:hypothetical protein
VWCAFCLDVISSNATLDGVKFPPQQALEQHHPLPQSTFRQVRSGLALPSNFPVGWTIPAHKQCHRLHFEDGFRVACVLNRALDITDLAWRDRWAKKAHDNGVYWLSLVMNLQTLRRYEAILEPIDRARLIERQLAAVSGVRSPVRPLGHAEIEAVPDDCKTRVFNHLANRSANRGALRAARAALERAQAFRHLAPRAEADLVRLSSLTRGAQVDRTPAAGRLAVEEARRVVGDGAYSHLTTLLLLGWNSLSAEQCSALRAFDEVLDYIATASWLFIAEALFGKACHALRFNQAKPTRIYQWLCQAQYIYVVLGLQGMPHTFLAAVVPVSDELSCFPGHVIQSAESLLALPRQERLALRTEALGIRGEPDRLYLALLDALSGDPGDRSRIASLVSQ